MSAWTGPAGARVPHLGDDAVERARLTVVPRRGPRAPRVPFVVLVSLVLLGGLVGLLVVNTHMQQQSFRATALEADAAELHATEQSLRMELDQLRDPQRVALQAQGLGMVPMVNPAFLRLSGGAELGRPIPAAAADRQRLSPLPPPKPVTKPLDEPLVSGVDGVPSDTPGASPGTTEAGSTGE